MKIFHVVVVFVGSVVRLARWIKKSSCNIREMKTLLKKEIRETLMVKLLHTSPYYSLQCLEISPTRKSTYHSRRTLAPRHADGAAKICNGVYVCIYIYGSIYIDVWPYRAGFVCILS